MTRQFVVRVECAVLYYKLGRRTLGLADIEYENFFTFTSRTFVGDSLKNKERGYINAHIDQWEVGRNALSY